MNSQIVDTMCSGGCQKRTLSLGTAHLCLVATQLTCGLDLLKAHRSCGQVSLRKFPQEFCSKVQLFRKYLLSLPSSLLLRNYQSPGPELFLVPRHQLGCLQQHYLKIKLDF